MQPSDILTIVIAVAGSGLLGATVNGLFSRRHSGAEAEKFKAEAEKFRAEAADQVTETALELVEELKFEQNELKSEVQALRAIAAENHKFQIAFIVIEDQVREANIKPAVTLRDLAKMTLDDLMCLAEARGIRLPRLAR